MIKAVIFDLDETLLDRTVSLVNFLRAQHAQYLQHLGSASFDIWRDRFLSLDAGGLVQKSRVYPQIIKEFAGNAAIAAQLIADYNERCSRFAVSLPGMTEVLVALRAQGYALGIITNGFTDFQMRHVKALGLETLVDVILVSEAEGVRKPETEIFTRAAARLGATPQECVFVGDNPSADIMGAVSAGMHAVWLRRKAAWPANLPKWSGPTVEDLMALPAVLENMGRSAERP